MVQKRAIQNLGLKRYSHIQAHLPTPSLISFRPLVTRGYTAKCTLQRWAPALCALGWLLHSDNVQLVCVNQTEDKTRAVHWWCIFIAMPSSENPQLTPPPEALAPALRETPSNKELQQAARCLFWAAVDRAAMLSGLLVRFSESMMCWGGSVCVCVCLCGGEENSRTVGTCMLFSKACTAKGHVCVEVCLCVVCLNVHVVTSRPLNLA